ncbi:hypothetical protein [Kitasatospora sp. NPDC085879]|uniref:hypothetical protein n=1 Tax=Kitasatospora sp. NPDC085879 TaxID=3154769 RepID=UPI0034374710
MPVLLLPGAANQYLRNRQAHLFTAMWRKGVDHALHADVWQEALTEVGPSMEVRVFGFGEWMVERIQNHLRAVFDPIWAVFHRMLFNEWSQFLLVGVPLGIVYLAVAEDAARGRASTAVLTAVLTASWALVQSLGYSDDVRNIRAATESLLAYERLREILTPQAGTVDALPAPPARSGATGRRRWSSRTCPSPTPAPSAPCCTGWTWRSGPVNCSPWSA